MSPTKHLYHHHHHHLSHRQHDDHQHCNRQHQHHRAHRGVQWTVLVSLSVLCALYLSATLATYLAAPSASASGPPAKPPSAAPFHLERGGQGREGEKEERAVPSVHNDVKKVNTKRSDIERRLSGIPPKAEEEMKVFPESKETKFPFDVEDSNLSSPRQLFPISAIRPEEYEIIIHPATEVMERMPNMANKDKPGPMRVPKFWDGPPGAQFGGSYDAVRAYLGNYGERLMTRDEALSIGSVVPMEVTATASTRVSSEPDSFEKSREEQIDDPHTVDTIFVMIASYRDWQCPQTVESLYSRAKYPHRIRVAVVDQTSAGDVKCSDPPRPCSDEPTQALCRFKELIDVYEMDSDLAVGPVFARHIASRMYRGEYFALQIDAHVSFVQSWDVDVINQWKSANNEMAVLSVYLHNDADGRFDKEKGFSLDKTRPIMCQTDYDGKGARRHLRHFAQPAGIPRITDTPTIEPYWGAGFSFGRGHFVVNVPYDQHLPMIFQGEEISITLRGFTYGYDYYTPERSVAFHSYAVGENKEKRGSVHKFWEHTNLYAGSGTEAFKRLNGILRMNGPDVKPDPWLLHVDEKLYGIGKVRDLSKFFDTFGIHVDSQTVEHHLCRFAGWTMHHMFMKHLRQDGMGIDYSGINYKFKDPAPDDPVGLPQG